MTGVTRDEREAIERAALDYYEGWFDGDPVRMERALHPQLVKRSLSQEKTTVDTISAREMVDSTAAGAGLARDPGRAERGIEVHVDHVYGDIATTTVTSAVYVDYLQLARTREGWKIVNVLWDSVPPQELDSATRSIWALGDYHRFAKETVWELGRVLVEACGISSGQRVLDVATGSGNVALRAAEAGAKVVASDQTSGNFEAGRREARAQGVELDWVEADAQELPFSDGEFDVVTSSLGAIFAPDHRAVADELLRVCRPGGTIGMINFTPEGLAAEFFEVFAPYAPPPPPGALPPLLWGSEQHVREVFGDRVEKLQLTRREYVERAESPNDYCALFKETFGPAVAIYESLADQPERAAALDRDFLEFATRANRGRPDGPAEYPYEYLLVIAAKRT